MKFLIATLLLVPGMAFANGSGVRCTTDGSLGPVTVKITSDESLLTNGAQATVVARGRRTILVHTVNEILPAEAIDEVKISLKQIETQTGQILPNGTQAILTLKKDIISENPFVVVTGDTGLLQITQFGSSGRILSTEYPLSECKGVL